MVTHLSNYSTQKQRQVDLCKFQTRLGYFLRTCLKNNKKTNEITTSGEKKAISLDKILIWILGYHNQECLESWKLCGRRLKIIAKVYLYSVVAEAAGIQPQRKLSVQGQELGGQSHGIQALPLCHTFLIQKVIHVRW